MLYEVITLAIAIAAILLAIAAWQWLRPGANGGATVETAAVERGDISRSVATSGSVEALVMVEVGSQLSGQIKELYADFNDQVKEGALVALISYNFV